MKEIIEQFPDLRDQGKTNIEQCHLVLFRMLQIFDFLCRQHGIVYWLTAGALIGAVRHGGFIPWDCDIDLGFDEGNFNKLQNLIASLPDDMFFQTADTDPAFYSSPVFAKLRDRYSNYVQFKNAYPSAEWQNGLQIDLCCYRYINGVYISPIKQRRHLANVIFPLQEIEFESGTFMAPRDIKTYLTIVYGDYMTLPPVSERVAHEGLVDPFQSDNHQESRGNWFHRFNSTLTK